MDFGELLYAAQRNEHNTKKEVKCYKTKFEPPKKELKSQKTLSTNIQKFLARKEEEERQKQEEAKKKRDELLSLRAQDGKAKKRVAAMLKRTKAANKAAIADAVDNDNTAVTISGLAAQPDEDDYGYVSQEAAAFYDKLLQKYNSTPSEAPLFSKKVQLKSDAKDLNNTKDRVRMALLRQEEEEMMPHKRKRKTKEEKSKEQSANVEEKDDQEDNEEPEPPQEKAAKPKRPPAPPPLDFQQLLKIAEKKQYEPIKIEPKVKQDEDERPMTKKQRVEYMKEQEWRMRKEGKLPPLSSASQNISNHSINSRPQTGSRATSDQVFKHPADSAKGARPMLEKDNHSLNRGHHNADRPRVMGEKGSFAGVKIRQQNANVERIRPVNNSFKERNYMENSYTKERGGAAEVITKHRPMEECTRPLEDISREKRQSESNFKEIYRSGERSQLLGRSRDKSQGADIHRGGVGYEKKEYPAGNGHKSNPKISKINNAQRAEKISSSSIIGDSKFKKLQGNSNGKVSKERNMVNLFGDDSAPVMKASNSFSSDSASNQKKASSTNMSGYSKKLQESLIAKLEERERFRASSSSSDSKPNVGSLQPNMAKMQSLSQNRALKQQQSTLKGDLMKKEMYGAKPTMKSSMQKPTAAFVTKPQDGLSKGRLGNETVSKTSKTPLSVKDIKSRPFPPADVKPRQFPPADVRTRQFPPPDVKTRQFPPPDVKTRQFPPPDIRNRQFPPQDVRRKQFPPDDVRRKPKPPVKRRIEDSDDEHDSELDDFIDDGPQDDEMDYSKHIKEIFGYDKSRYADVGDDDDECMESSFSQQLKEEFVSTKLGIMEDLEDIRKEKEMEKRKKMRMMKKK